MEFRFRTDMAQAVRRGIETKWEVAIDVPLAKLSQDERDVLAEAFHEGDRLTSMFGGNEIAGEKLVIVEPTLADVRRVLAEAIARKAAARGPAFMRQESPDAGGHDAEP